MSDGQRDPNRTKIALVLSAGAPHSPLMAGALCAIYREFKSRDRQKKNDTKVGEKDYFDIIYTSGAGALIGLLLAAPKNGDPEKALQSVVDMGISDPIYSLLPINFKAFHKPGPFTRPIRELAALFKLDAFPVQRIDHPVSPLGHWYNYWVNFRQQWRDAADGGLRRFYNDLVDFWAAAITPTTLNWWSKGICDPLPFIEELVDFKKLNEKKGDFFLNFYTPSGLLRAAALDDARRAQMGPPTQPLPPSPSGTGPAMRVLKGEDIKPEHVRGAFAFPFIYTPVKVGEDLAFEGANWDPISFGNLLEPGRSQIDMRELRTVILVDIISILEPFLLREPQNLWDAFGLFIMLPVVAHAKKELSRFEKDVNPKTGEHTKGFIYRKIRFDIPPRREDHILDWSHSNMSRMFKLGVEAGEQFCLDFENDLFFGYPRSSGQSIAGAATATP